MKSAAGWLSSIGVMVALALAVAFGGRVPEATSPPKGERATKDDRGKSVTLPTTVQHAAPLFPPSIDEYLIDTGRPETVAVSQRFNREPLEHGLLGRVFPGARSSVSLSLGPSAATSVEALLRLSPDVVFANRGTAPALERVGLPTLVIDNPGDLRYALGTARIFTAALGEPERSTALLNDYRRRLSAIAAEVAQHPLMKRPRVALLYVYQRRITANGPGEFLAHFIELAGGANAFESGGLVHLDRERLLAADPDVIFVMTTASSESAPRTFSDDPSLASVSAVRAHRVYRVMPGLAFFPMGLSGYPLFVRWMAELIQPGLQPTLRSEVRETYLRYTGYTMSEQDIDEALAVRENHTQTNYSRFERP